MSKSLDRLTLLSTFARIAGRRSVSAAARDLGLSQASASRQLAELEARLGVQLVQRTTHSLALTDAGEIALVEARLLLDGWDALSERFAEDDGALRGSLRVIAPVALGQEHLADAALQFQLDHPEVAISWHLEDAPIRFAETGCDLWIRIGRPEDDRLIVRDIGTVERLLVAAPGLVDGRAIDGPLGLQRLPCVAVGPFEGAAIPLTHRTGDSHAVAARVAMTTNNMFAARAAARVGVGYAVMPRWFVEDDLSAGALVDVLPDWRAPQLTITASYLPVRRQTRRLRAFAAHMIAAVQAVPGISALASDR